MYPHTLTHTFTWQAFHLIKQLDTLGLSAEHLHLHASRLPEQEHDTENGTSCSGTPMTRSVPYLKKSKLAQPLWPAFLIHLQERKKSCFFFFAYLQTSVFLHQVHKMMHDAGVYMELGAGMGL